MKFNLRSNLFTEEELESVISILDEKTKILDIEIFISNGLHHSKRIIQPFTDEKIVNRLDDDNMKGTLCSKITKENMYQDFKVFLFEYNFQQDSFGKLQMIYVLFHEIRHAYQKVFFREACLQLDKHYISDGSNPLYHEQWLEQDANYFSHEMCQAHFEFLSNLIGYEDWHLIEPVKPCPIEEVQFI